MSQSHKTQVQRNRTMLPWGPVDLHLHVLPPIANCQLPKPRSFVFHCQLPQLISCCNLIIYNCATATYNLQLYALALLSPGPATASAREWNREREHLNLDQNRFIGTGARWQHQQFRMPRRLDQIASLLISFVPRSQCLMVWWVIHICQFLLV